MSSKQLLRLAAVLVAVLVLWGAVALASRRSERESGAAEILPKLDTSSIDTVRLTGASDSAILTRAKAKAAGWLVNGRTADKEAVSGLLKALADSNAKAELVARNPASHSRLRVSDDSGRRVRVSQKGRTLVDLIAGKPATEGDGIYLRRSGSPDVYVMRGELGQALTRSVEDWRDHTIASVVPDSVATVEIRRGNRSYTLRRRGSAWVFGSGAATDSGAVSRLLTAYREIKAAGFATKAQEDSVRRSRSRRAARLANPAGATILSLTFDSIPGGLWVRSGAQGELYRLDTWTADQLTPEERSLRKR